MYICLTPDGMNVVISTHITVTIPTLKLIKLRKLAATKQHIDPYFAKVISLAVR